MTESLYEKVRHFFPTRAQQELKRVLSAKDAKNHQYTFDDIQDPPTLTETYEGLSSVIDLKNKTITINNAHAIATFAFAQDPVIGLGIAPNIVDTYTRIYQENGQWHTDKTAHTLDWVLSLINVAGNKYKLDKSGFMALAKICVNLPNETINVRFQKRKRGSISI